MKIQALFKNIVQTFEAHSNPAEARKMKQYLRNQFDFYGIKSVDRRAISKPFFAEAKGLKKTELLKLVKTLWEQPQRELHYFAQEALFKSVKKVIDQPADIEFLEWMVTHKSWWDTVDFVAPKLMKIYFEKFPDNRAIQSDKWIQSGNIWLKRSAILIHLKTKEKTDFDLLEDTILKLNTTKEFFIDKAIGWVLREQAKRHEDRVMQLLQEHHSKLANLSVREALKHHPDRLKNLL